MSATGPRTMVERDADPLRRHRLLGQIPALSWPRHFFPRAFRSKSACMLRSANMRFSRRFSFGAALDPMALAPHSRVFIWLIMDASMPPYLARHL